jgi:hypothetical protein
MYTLLNKKDFLNMLREENKEEFKNMKIKDLREYFKITHISNGEYKNMSGFCFKCLTPLKPDFIKFENYCMDC